MEKNCEFTIEIDPGTITEQEIDEWIKVGVNRFSVGVQSLNDKFLEIMDRKHGRKEIFELLEILHRKQLSFSIDFMIGLPYSEKYNRDIVAELEELKKYQPQHFSLYILSTRKNYVLREELPTNDFSAEEYLTVVQYLKSLGFKHYEVSNFALDGFESKHNLKYWNIEEVAAIGPNATGLIKINSEKQIRYKWKPQSPLYEIEILNQNEILLEKLYMNLRSKIGLDLSEIFQNKIPLEVNKMVEGWIKAGYAQFINNRVILSSEGFLILDSLIGQMMHWV